MDTLTAMKVFCSVVENNSLAGASRRSMSLPPVVSKQLSGLEDRLCSPAEPFNAAGQLTEVGSAYYERCKRILADVDEAEIAVSQAHSAPRGLLKITAPTTFAHRHVAPHLPEFLNRYPEVEVQLLVNDRVVDLVDEGIDLAIRIAQLKDSSLIARKLAVNHRVIVASPDYLKKWGQPQTPDQLNDHSLITYTPGNPINDWHFMVDNQQKILRAKGALAMNNGDSVLQTVLSGGGLAMLAAFMAGEHVKSGKLVTLLKDYVRADVPIYAVIRAGRYFRRRSGLRRLLVDLYNPTPYWL